jgi:outer membrane protein assembly factor BamB
MKGAREMKVRVILAATVLLIVAGSSLAADWPQWQGPNRDGKSADTGLLKQWPENGPPLAWKIDKLGGGDGGPAIVAGRIFVMSNRGDKEVVWALSEKDGSEIWVAPLGPAFQQQPAQGKEGPSCTPTVDGERLYVEGLGGNVACLQVQDGKIVWQRSLTEDFGGRRPMWSYRESPLVDGDKVIVTPGGADAILVALNKLTGETIWKAKMPDSPAGASGAPGGFGGPGAAGGPGGGRGGSSGAGGGSARGVTGTKDPGLFSSEHFAMTAFSCKIPNGKYLAKLYFAETYQGITGPGQRVFSFNVQGQEFKDFDIWVKAGGPKRAYIETVPVEVTNGAVQAEEVYATTDMQNHHGGMIFFDGCLYGTSGGNEGGALVCLDFKTGKVLWDQRATVGRRAKGSLALADGMLYYRMEDGTMCLIEPNPKQYTERGRFQQPDRTRLPAWAHPVVANGKLYVRDQDVLFCYNVQAK